ncbi:HD domain-containing protein [Bacillus sp. HMF5848]|uniref:HD-GYP domain-containing protein n=1 Tax=Bacillus sp. HMF5848 TaxID=2495421 RepID=UPI000F7B1453|nr:HD domain-containing phosphohydrolase [Bacillus sp. HMF5848]RSK28651.1 HD domain-containing protein [Bacillus sp. HMF5848]
MFKVIEISPEIVGEVLAEDIFSESGMLLLKAGTVLTHRHIVILQNQIVGTKVKIKQAVTTNRTSFTMIAQKEIELETLYEESLSKIEEKLSLIKKEQVPHVDEVKEIYSPLLKEILSNDNLSSLLKIMHQSSKTYIYAHSLNVSIMSALIGRILGKKGQELFEIAEMGFFHDIGMLTVPEEILAKSSKLDAQEMHLIREHPSKGARILQKMGEKRQSIIMASMFHHERIDGSGYPKKITGPQIPYAIQIVTVADIFTAMTSPRPYKQAFSQLQACQEIMNDMLKGHLNPAIVVPLVRYIMRQHVRENVKLSDGRKGEIIFIHDNEPHQPLLRFEDGTYIDLRRQPRTFIVNTLRTNS